MSYKLTKEQQVKFLKTFKAGSDNIPYDVWDIDGLLDAQLEALPKEIVSDEAVEHLAIFLCGHELKDYFYDDCVTDQDRKDYRIEARELLTKYTLLVQDKKRAELAKEGREQVKTWLLNNMCSRGRSTRQYVFLGTDYITQCKKWDSNT